MDKKVSLTTQNRLIVFGLLLSTVLIMAIAVFSVINIQKKLNEGYQNFGQVISKTLAIESAEITKNLDFNEIYKTLKAHTDSILKSHNDIVFIEFTDKDGKVIHSDTNESHKSTKRPNITVSSPLTNISNTPVGSVTVGLSGNIISQISSVFKNFQNLRQRSRFIRCTQTNHVCQRYSKTILFQHSQCFLRIGNNHSQNTEIRIICHAKSRHIDTFCTQYFSHMI